MLRRVCHLASRRPAEALRPCCPSSHSWCRDFVTSSSDSGHLRGDNAKLHSRAQSSMLNSPVTRVRVPHFTPTTSQLPPFSNPPPPPLGYTHCVNVYCTLTVAPTSLPRLNSCVCTSPGTSMPTTPQDLYPPWRLVPEQNSASKAGWPEGPAGAETLKE